MAACLITLGGTSGSLLLQYTSGGNKDSMVVHFGSTVYINDASTLVTYTTISGNLTASSSCVTITELPVIYYILSWETYSLNGSDPHTMEFDKVMLDNEAIELVNVNYSTSKWENLALNINNVGDPRIRITAGKRTATSRGSYNQFMICRVIGVAVPKLKILNNAEGHVLYVAGVVTSNPAPAGYTTYGSCTGDLIVAVEI